MPPPSRSQPRLSEGVPGADIPQLPVGAGRGAPAVAVAGQQLRLQLRLGAGAMTAGAAGPHGHLSPEPPASTGSRWPPLHPPFAVKTDACQLQLGHRQRGNLERRLPRRRGWVFIYLFCRSFLSICSERRGLGGWGEGRGTRLCCKKVVETNWNCVGWCEGFCMTGEGPFWGSIAMAYLALGPSFPPPPAGQPVFTHNLCRSLPQPAIPAGGTEMLPTQDAASVLWGSPSDPSG